MLMFSFFASIHELHAQNCSVNAGVNETICAGDAFNLKGQTSGLVAGNSTWTQLTGPSVLIQDASDPETPVVGMSGGNTYSFRLSADCQDNNSVFQDVTISVEPITIADAGTGLGSCPDNSGSLVVTGNSSSPTTSRPTSRERAKRRGTTTITGCSPK